MNNKLLKTTRRRFLLLASSLCAATIANEVSAGILRRRRRRNSCPAAGPATSTAARSVERSASRPSRSSTEFVRHPIAALTGDQLESLRRGVATMKARPAADPRSWRFQANMHGTLDPSSNPLFNQCEHGTLLFLAWHRGYLYYFERILRQAADDPQLTLPYWDWTTAPQIPEPYRDPPASSNSLFDGTREMNDGSALPTEVVEDDLESALARIAFPQFGSSGFSPALEGSPHGAVHVFVGGNMGSVPTAARDPIFWLHHCNIDRLWDRWLNMGGGRKNPTNASFLNTQYTFIDEEGSTVTRRVADILSSSALGYEYDDVPNPSAAAVELTASAESTDEQQEPVVVATSAAGAEPASTEPERLAFEPKTVTLSVVEEQRARLQGAGADEAQEGQVLLRIVGLEFDQAPTFTYGVYLNLPEGEVSARIARQHYLGAINLFGGGHAEHDQMEAAQTFDATQTVARLKEAGEWNAEQPDVRVTLRPLTRRAAGAGGEQIRARAQASAAQANIRYERIELLMAPE